MHPDNRPPNSNHIRRHNHETYVTITGAARQTHTTTSAISRWIRDGRIQAHRIGTDRRQWLKVHDLGPAIDSLANKPNRRPFTEQDLAVIMRSDLTAREAAIMLGRNPDVITSTRRRLADRIPA